METFYTILKFGAIFLGGISGMLALLVEFKKDGKITKWGKAALFSVIISFIITALIQTIEINKNDKAALDEQKKNIKLLNEISRGIYTINNEQTSYDVGATIKLNFPVFKPYKKRLEKIIKGLRANPAIKLPPGVSSLPEINISTNEKKLWALVIRPESSLYPNQISEPDVFNLIGQFGLDISIYSKAPDSSLTKTFKISDSVQIFYSTEIKKPNFLYIIDEDKMEMRIQNLKIDLTSYAWANTGTLQSLPDLSEAIVRIDLSDRVLNNLDDKVIGVTKEINLMNLVLHIGNRIFAFSQLCQFNLKGFPGYYVRLPSNMLKTELNINCK